MGYYNGLNEFLKAPELVDKLFALVRSNTLTVSRQAVELLFVLCNYNGWKLVHKSAKTIAKDNGDKPYAEVVKLLQLNDIDTQVRFFFSC
jgi:hypothetical protein